MASHAALPLEHTFVPSGRDTDDRVPAVVVMHGRGADDQDLLPIAQHLPDSLATVSLRAPDRLMGGYTWYELDMSEGGLHRSQPEAEGFRRSLDLVSRTIPAAVDEYGLDADHVGLLGFSQGAIMTFSLLLEDPGSYAWVTGLHGYLAASHADLEPAGIASSPVFVGAGTADQIIPARRVEAAAERFRELGCAVTFATYPVGHGVGQEELADLVEFVDANSA